MPVAAADLGHYHLQNANYLMGIFVNVLIEKGGGLNSVPSIMKSRHCYGHYVNILLPLALVAKAFLNK